MAERVCVAQIGAAHGVRGEVRLHSFTQEPLAVADYGPLQSEDGKRTLTIETVRAAKDHLVARFAGVADRDQAQALRNVKLYVARDRLPPADDDEFYHADLIGLSVVTAEGADLGTVKAVHNFGAGDILEIVRDGDANALMLPFTAQTIPSVDIKAKRIVANPPAETEARGED